AETAKREGFEVIIFSEDKDFLQLESQEIKVLNPRTFEFTYAQEKLGIPSKWVSDFLALTGDTIDNIPGVPGIGPKTASKLINKFGGVEDIFNNLPKIEQEKLRKSIEEHKEQILMSKELATIRSNCDIEIETSDLQIGEKDESALISIFRELEFFSIIKKIKPAEPKEYKIGENLKNLLNSIKKEVSVIFFDSYFSLACNEEEAFVFKEKEEELAGIMETPEIKKITPYSKHLFKKFDLVQGVFDIGLASYLLKPGINDYSLDQLATLWLGEALSTLNFKKREFSEQELINWLGERASISHKLHKVLKEELEKEKLYKLFSEVELPLARVLADMEEIGVLIDRDYFAQESSVIGVRLKELEKEVYKDAGEEFNLRSPSQISHILFEKLGYPKSKHRKKGYSTDQEVLTELAKTYEIPKKLLEYRELFKLKSTYLDAIPALADSADRVHTTWQQTVTATGRLSSTNPNLQNIPRREIRKGFIASPGWFILSADYSQIELRILASISEDDALIEAFKQNKDIHTETASLIFGIPESQVTTEERKKAKVVNFGIVYGMGPYGLSQRLKIGVEEASTFIASYFLTYPGVKNWINRLLALARENGYVETLLGRKRWLSGINSNNAHVREFEE
ncbi:DNA polymerase I, partial [candidate division WOR-3 bacterium]|nr:DNA polymerase I [candidate division WOR-3 bacterium]